MGPATIIAILGFCISMVALWLVSDVIKTVNNQNEKFLRTHIASIREELRNTDQALAKMAKEVKALTDFTADINSVRSHVAKVAEDLGRLDRSIPQRYRTHAMPPKEAEQKAAAKPKPTTQ